MATSVPIVRPWPDAQVSDRGMLARPGQARPVHILLMRASAVHITYVSSSTGKGTGMYQTEVTGFMVIPKISVKQ